MKKIILSIAAFTSIVSAIEIFGVSVDQATLPEQLLQTAELVKHTDSLKNQLLSQTEIRDSIQFMKDISQLQKVMDEWKVDLMDLNIDNPQSQIGVLAKQLFNEYNLFDDCKPLYYDESQKRICQNEMIRNVQEISAYQSYSDDLKERSNKLAMLSERLANATDIKESQDINNAIQMEIAQLQATKAQIELMTANNEATAKAEQRQKEQIYNKNRLKRIDWSNAPLPTSL